MECIRFDSAVAATLKIFTAGEAFLPCAEPAERFEGHEFGGQEEHQDELPSVTPSAVYCPGPPLLDPSS
jgi:hypothetical protein